MRTIGEKPFGDHNMTMRTLQANRHSSWLDSQVDRMESVKRMQNDLSRRHSLINKYSNEQSLRFIEKDTSVIFSPKYSLSQAETLISRFMFAQRHHRAATFIQSAWRGSVCRKWYKETSIRRWNAAKKLQKNWCWFRFLKLGPITKKKRLQRCAIMIQKYMKGYLHQKRSLWAMMDKKTTMCHDHFNEVKAEYTRNAIQMICYYILKKVKRKREAKRLDDEKKKKAAAAAAAKKKKSKYPSRSTVVAPKTQVTAPVKQNTIVKKTPPITNESSKGVSGNASGSGSAECQKNKTATENAISENMSQQIDTTSDQNLSRTMKIRASLQDSLMPGEENGEERQMMPRLPDSQQESQPNRMELNDRGETATAEGDDKPPTGQPGDTAESNFMNTTLNNQNWGQSGEPKNENGVSTPTMGAQRQHTTELVAVKEDNEMNERAENMDAMLGTVSTKPDEAQMLDATRGNDGGATPLGMQEGEGTQGNDELDD